LILLWFVLSPNTRERKRQYLLHIDFISEHTKLLLPTSLSAYHGPFPPLSEIDNLNKCIKEIDLINFKSISPVVVHSTS
jgi:hypothetical protein